MGASDSPIGTVTQTPARGWAVLLLFQAQGSSVILISYTLTLLVLNRHPLLANQHR